MRTGTRTHKDELVKQAIITCVYESAGLSAEQLYKRSKKPTIVYPRQLCMYLLCKLTNLHEEDIAQLTGFWHRTAVIKSRNVIADRLCVEEQVQKDIYLLRQKIASKYESLNTLRHQNASFEMAV